MKEKDYLFHQNFQSCLSLQKNIKRYNDAN